MILDSNIAIYASKPEHADLRRFIADNAPAVSAISYVEVLGYHQLSAEDKRFFEEFFAAAKILPITDAVLQKAVKLRQVKRMSLGDAIIAATALVHDEALVTRNARDFAWISGLKLLNPFDQTNGPLT